MRAHYTVLTAAATVTSLLAGLATTLTVIWYLGAGRESDVVFAAGTVPAIIVQILLGSVGATIMPLMATRDMKEQSHVEWGLIALASVVMLPLVFVLWCAAPWWAPMTIPGLSDAPELPALARWYLAAGMLNAIVLVALPMVQARGRFFAAELLNAIAAVIGLVGTITLLPIIGLVAVPVCAMARYGLQALLLLSLCSRPVMPRMERSFLGEVLRRHLPLMWSGALFKTSPFFDRLLCSFLPPGMLTFYHLVLQAFQAVSQVFQRAIVAPFLGRLARLHEAGDLSSALSLYRQTMRMTLLASTGLYLLGVSAGIAAAWVFLPQLIPLALVDSLPWVALSFAGLFMAGLWGQLAAAWFHSCGRTKFPAVIGSVGFLLTTATKAILLPVLGIFGVAIGASLGQLGNYLVMERVIRTMRKKPLV